MPAISVIIPTRQRHHLLARCLASIEAQTWRDFEVVLVDDNPPESRVRAETSLRPWLDQNWLRLVENDTPLNAARARNRGLEQAGGEWITFLDDDDAYQPGKLAKQMAGAAHSGLPVGLCGYTYHLAGRLRVLRRREQFLSGGDLLLYFPGMPAVFHRKAPAIRFAEELSAGEDAHYYQALLKHFDARSVFNVPESLVDVYPQAGARVNLDARAQLAASRMIERDYGDRYDQNTLATYRLRTEIGCLKHRPGGFGTLLRAACQLARLRGLRDWRFVLNSLLFKIPIARRFLVS